MKKDDQAGTMAAAERRCADHGAPLKGTRREVLERLLAAGRPVRAYDLLTGWRGGRGYVAPPIVYRALHSLEACGLVHKVAALNAYLASPALWGGVTPVLLICKQCEATVELDTDVTSPIRSGARAHDFEIKRWSVEVVGLCAACTQP